MQGAFASDDVGCMSSEECGLRQPHGPVTTLGRRGRTACNAKGRDRAPCRVRAGTLASRVTEGQTRTVTELGSRRPEPEYPIQEVRIWGPGPSVPGAEPAPEVRKCAGRVAISRPYVALTGLETRSVTRETEAAGTWASIRSDFGVASGTERRSVVRANSCGVICFKVKVAGVHGFNSHRTGDRVKITVPCVFHGGKYFNPVAFPVTGTSMLLNQRLLVVYVFRHFCGLPDKVDENLSLQTTSSPPHRMAT